MHDPYLALPPVRSAEGKPVVPADFQSLMASVRFDAARQVAEVSASVELSLLDLEGWPAFDLRQDAISKAAFDGADLPVAALAHRDMGAGYEARMRAVEVDCEAGSRHLLQLRYRLGAPQAEGANEVEWLGPGNGLRWDLWMSDLEPGRYLEMWLPANLCHDRLSMALDIEVAGTPRPHALLANGAVDELEAGRHWTVRYPSSYTSLSPMLVLAPLDEVALRVADVTAAGRRLSVTAAGIAGGCGDLEAAVNDAAAWLSYFSTRYGAWAHGDRFLAVLWDAPRGMEYDGATTASPAALEHEVFHSWFGRGVKPAHASDGWMDEAMATWATASRKAGHGRYGCEELGLDEAPTTLSPAHPWSRHTPRDAYPAGSRLLEGIAYLVGGAGRLREVLADWHHAYCGKLASSEDLRQHLGRWCERDLRPWWDRYVYGLQ
jgi:hypothetical protein